MPISRKEMNDAVQKFINEGGEVVQLKYANEKILNKSHRKAYHILRQEDNPLSKEYLEREDKKESQLIFSKDDRLRQ
jgi:hypothetical protein